MELTAGQHRQFLRQEELPIFLPALRNLAAGRSLGHGLRWQDADRLSGWLADVQWDGTLDYAYLDETPADVAKRIGRILAKRARQIQHSLEHLPGWNR